MQIVPVIDILNGIVVHGRAGHRESYQPIQSQLTDSVDPSQVLRVLIESCDATTGYVADLNGLMKRPVQTAILRRLAGNEFGLMIDAGVRSVGDIEDVPDGDNVRVILASEAIPSDLILADMVAGHPNRRFVFSFDLTDGILKSPVSDWKTNPIADLASRLADLGILDWIVLDVRSVGMGTGPSSVKLCEQLKAQFPDARLTTGGGIRNRADLQTLKDAGVSEVLLATALHDKTISRLDVKSLFGSS